MKAQSATEKSARNTRIAEAVSRPAVGAAQQPATHGQLEVTDTGLVLHLAPEFFGEPAAKRRRN